jgi:hypothetical protein
LQVIIRATSTRLTLSRDDTGAVHGSFEFFERYFPSGIYFLGATPPLKIPSGSRIVSEGWPSLCGYQIQSHPSNPAPIVQIGQKGEVGVCEISEMHFNISTIPTGVKIIEVDMAGRKPGDVTARPQRCCPFAAPELH